MSMVFATTATATRRRRMNAPLLVCGRSFLARLPKKQKARGNPGPLHFLNYGGLEIHAAHAATARHCPSRVLLLRHFSDHGLGCDQEAGHGCRILNRRTHDLGWVDNALCTELTVITRTRS